MLTIPVHDCTAGFRCYRRTVLESIDLDTIQAQGYAFQVELAYRTTRQGFKVVETPIVFMDRRVGKSKMSHKIFVEGFLWVLRTRFGKKPPIHTLAEPQNNNQVRTVAESKQVEEVPSVARKSS